MSSRFLLSLVAAAVLQACLVRRRRAGRRARAPAWSSPSWARPRPASRWASTAARPARPRPRPSAPCRSRRSRPRKGAEWRGNSSHPSAEKEDEDKAAAKKADDKKAGDKKADGKKADADEADGRQGRRQGRRAEKPAKAERARRAPGAAASAMDVLREKLAAKLGAKPAADGKFAMQVSNRGETGENVITSVRPSAAAVAAAHRPKRAGRRPSPATPTWTSPPTPASRCCPRTGTTPATAAPTPGASCAPNSASARPATRQSPIDIRGGIAVDLEPIKFDYRPSAFSVIDNGHTVQVNVEPGNSITITGKRYELVQFHFHRPSEERINGRQYDMVAHLVHKDVDGKLAVVAVLLDRGSAQAIVQSVWNNLPLEKGDEVRAGTRIDLAQLLPEDKRYYTYMGSLTTPPCSEGVLWMVMKQPVPISVEQVGDLLAPVPDERAADPAGRRPADQGIELRRRPRACARIAYARA